MPPANVHAAADNDQAVQLLQAVLREGDYVLVKGSRGVGLDRTVAALAVFGYSLRGVNWWGAAVSVLVLLFSLWVIGVFLANFLAWSRLSGAFLNYLEMPVAFLCGFMYPVRVLPGKSQSLPTATRSA